MKLSHKRKIAHKKGTRRLRLAVVFSWSEALSDKGRAEAVDLRVMAMRERRLARLEAQRLRPFRRFGEAVRRFSRALGAALGMTTTVTSRADITPQA
ncbi:hypothetical protein [Enterovibrio norvegicus]|uniref:hypothetical protein n=1 Tax=Enterovibrio norvegicus TaxID=188144 RepID=UPI000C825ADE|nr:hypothetical protein [Enterovibrio norvegicus]PMN73170.1 hypothetical protein BCT27_12565 [Enterovibrio norvegicus]